MELAHASHSVYKIRYHMVFQVKYRKIVLSEQIEIHIRKIMQGIQERYIQNQSLDKNHYNSRLKQLKLFKL